MQQLDLAARWLNEHLAMPDPSNALCRYLALSRTTLNRLFRKHFKMSSAAYVHMWKMKNSKLLLRKGSLSIKEIAHQLGYKHPNDFSRAYKRYTGDAPTNHRRG